MCCLGFCAGTDTASMSHVLLLHDTNNCVGLDAVGEFPVTFAEEESSVVTGRSPTVLYTTLADEPCLYPRVKY